MTSISPSGEEWTSHSDYYSNHNFNQSLQHVEGLFAQLNELASGAVSHGRRVALMDHLSKEGELDRLWDAQSRNEAYPLSASYEPVDPLEIARLADFDALTSVVAGRAAKYLVAWDGVHAETLADSWFFSLPHALEADYDLHSSFLLACHGLHKQSLLVLRTFLEDVVLPLHFFVHDGEFADWKSRDDYFVPRVGGARGMARSLSLAGSGVLGSDLAAMLEQQYGDLGKAVHGAERHLTHTGLVHGASPPGFRVDRLEDWARWFSKVADLGIRMLIETNNRWAKDPRRLEVCSTCHGARLEAIQQTFGWRVTCVDCGDVTTRSQLPPNLE